MLHRYVRSVHLACLLVLVGCPRPPLEFGKEGQITSAQALLERLDKRAESIKGMRATARVSVASPTQKGSVDELVSVTRPASLHLETLNFFGQPVAVLVTTGSRFSLLDSEKGVFYRGPASAKNLARLLPVQMKPEEVIAILLGSPPRLAGAKASLALDDLRGAYRLGLAREEERQTLWVGTRDLRVIESETRDARVRYGDFEENPVRSFAHHIRLDLPSDGSSVEVSLSDVEVNPETDPAMYRLDPTTGVNIVDLGPDGEPAAPR
jgi:outer membrane lipoprotein-sorting protein